MVFWLGGKDGEKSPCYQDMLVKSLKIERVFATRRRWWECAMTEVIV